MPLVDCFKLVGTKERKYLQKKAGEHIKSGLSEKEANIKAAKDYHSEVLKTIDNIYEQVGRKPKQNVQESKSDEAKVKAKEKIQALIESGDIEKADKGYKVLTEKGGKELKAITEELSKKAPPSLPKKYNQEPKVLLEKNEDGDYIVKDEDGTAIGVITDVKISGGNIYMYPGFDVRGKGYGQAAYLEMSKLFPDKKITSGDMSPMAEKMWEALHKKGLAIKFDGGYQLKTYNERNANKSDPKTKVVDAIREFIGTEKLGKREIEKIGEEAGITDKNVVKELAELAVVQKARELAQNNDFEGLVKLYENQPNLTHRTNESIEKQQYSTPAPLAYSMGKYVGLDKSGKKFEPSAGNGMLTIVAEPKDFTVNEIDGVRRSNLETQGFNEVLNQDGSKDFGRSKQYDSVITNPPFGGVEAQSIEGYKFNELAQIMSAKALDTMKDDGRAAIIIGGNNQFDEKGQLKGRDRIYFNYLFNKYNVEDVIDISGDIYRKQGASFPIRVILINGRKATPEGVAPTKEWFGKQESTFDGIQERIKNTGYESLQSTKLVGGPTTDTGSRSSGISGQVKEQPVTTVPSEKILGTGEEVTGQPVKTGVGKPRSGTKQQSGGDSGINTSEQPLSESVEQQGPAEQPQQQQPEGAEVVAEPRPKRDRKVAVRSESGESTVNYPPVSKGKSFNVSTPANLQQEILDAQTNLENEVGDVDSFVQKNLGYKTKEEMYQALGAEQIDGVALAIRNIERGTGIIIGDQPGIGKGRQAAALVRYANQQGKTPIFLTKSAYLFTNFFGDLADINYGDIKPYIFNSKDASKFPAIFKMNGEVLHKAPTSGVESRPVPKDAKIILATYSQFSSERYKSKIDLFRKLAQDNILIMDESHMASGDDSNTSRVFQDILPSTKGVVYLSGTYAKRASNMPVYAMKTSMSEANMSPEELVEAINKGGNPLQEINASILTEAGEMIRRERTFKGIEVNTHTIGGEDQTIKERQIKQADAVTDVMRDIIEFQQVHVAPVIKALDTQQKGGKVQGRKGANLGGVTQSPYFQKVFNVINQLLYSIKSKDVAKLMVDEFKAGRKPFLAVKSTMEAMLNDMVDRGELKMGDPINPDFSFVIKKGLEGVMRITREDAQGNKTYENIPVTALPQQSQLEYKRILSKISNLKTGLTLSPIDQILTDLRAAGLRVAEITGRKIRVDFKGEHAYLEPNKKLSINEAYRQYNNGEIDVLIVNRSGSTGASAHASEKVKDQRPRTMFVLEHELDISELVQILFRINRSGQVNLPKYVFVSSTIPAEQRLMMMTTRKLKSLDANTTSNQKQSKGLIEVPEIFNKYGDQVVYEYLQDNPDINNEIGDPVKASMNAAGEMIPEEGAANKVTGKVAVLSADKQAAFYQDITNRYNKYINFLDEAGMNDLVIENLPLKAKTNNKSTTILGKGGRSRFGDDTYLEEVEVNVLKKPMTKAEIDHQINELGGERSAEFKEALDKYSESLYAKTEADVTAKFDKKINAIKSDEKLTPEVKQAEIKALNEEKETFMSGKMSAAEARIRYIESLLNFFKSGRAVMIPADYNDMRGGGVRPGIFMGFDINTSDPKAFLPSNVTLKFAINDSRRTLTLPASREGLVNFIRDSSYNLSQSFQKNTREEWDSLKKPKDREKRYVVTGNILQGLGKDTYRKGSIVKYTTEKGFVNTGILLPESFNPVEEQVSNTVMVPAKKAAQAITALPVGGEVTNSEGDVTIYRKGENAFRIRVPSAKQTGGKYFLDEGLNKIVINGRWDSVGTSMEAIVDDSRVSELLSYLGNKFSTSFQISKEQMASGNLYKPSSKGANIDEAKIRNRPKKTDVKPFNLADRIKSIFKKHGVSINEGSLRRKYDGVYKHMTQGVRVQSMWDLFVASHEMTHAIDAKHDISETIRKNASQKLQAEFIHAYENLYPSPKKSAPLKDKIQEGMAMVLEYYLADPQLIEQNYPEIVKHLFTDGGQFYKPEMGSFIKDMDEVVLDYQSLHPEDRINARIKWDGSNKESGVSTQTKVLHALTNDLITANMVDNMMGGELRAKAITPNVTMLRNIAAIAGNWIRKPFGPTEQPQTYVGNGIWAPKKGKYRVDDLLKELKTVDEIMRFSEFLVARRQYFDYIKIDQLEEEISQGNKTLQERFDQLSEIVERNKMPRDLVESVYFKFESKYSKASEIFDSINTDMIDFMEATELITSERANEYRSESGYASYQRYVEDEHLSDTDALNLSSGAKSKINQLKTRSGSALQILPPVYSQMVAISEVLRRGQLNLVWKAWADAAKANPEVAKMFEPVVLQDIKNTNDYQPVWEKGVQKWYKLSEESRMFAQALSSDQVNLLNAFLRGAARVFQASTTQFFAPFAAMNITIDASTRFMQTKTGLIPFISDIPTIGKAMTGLGHWMGLIDHSANNEFLEYMALGGRKQTLSGTLQLEPQEALESVLNSDWVTKSKTGFEKAIQVIEMPVNMTELVGRATEFRKALAKGYPTNVAMHLAANVGINFSNKGAMANNYVKSVAYMGAGIQAFSQFIKTAKENPARTGMAIGIMTTLASTAAIMVYAFGDDDEKIALANQAPEELARFIFIPNSMFGGKSGLIKIRIPEQGGNIAAAAQLYWQNRFMDAKIDFTDIYKTQEAMLPSQLRASQGLGLLGSYLPQAISPSIQAVTNTRFYPTMAPIVPDWMQDMDEYAQYDKYTSRTAKAIGELTQDEFIEISPKKVDFFVRAQFGRSVSLVQGLAEAALFGDPVKTYVNIFEDSDRFLFTGKIYNKFYEMRDEANEELRALKSTGKFYPVSYDILAKTEARVSIYNSIHKQLTEVGDAINNGVDVPIETRKALYDQLVNITNEELFKK
jgi:hypothetical protein